MRSATLSAWLKTPREELDAIYSAASAGNLPEGDTRGTAIVAGSFFSKTLAFVARAFAWQGKVFDIFSSDRQSGVLINKITPLSLSFIVAKVYRDASWLDGKETIVIDYSSTSFLAKAIRDEIREVEPGLYLGKVWWGKTRILDFALSYPPGKAISADSASRAGSVQITPPREEPSERPANTASSSRGEKAARDILEKADH